MRIAILNHEYPPREGGAANATFHLAQELAQGGHRVWVVTLGFFGGRRVSHDGRVVVIRVPFKRKRHGPLGPFEVLRLSSVMSCALRRLSRRLMADLVHAFFAFPAGVIAWRMARRKHIPCVVSLRGSDVPGFRQGRVQTLAYALVRPFLRASWRWPRCRVVANSNDLKSLAHASAPSVQIDVVPNGVDCTRFRPKDRPQDPSEPITLLTVGQLMPRKRLHLLIGMLPAIREKTGRDVRVVIIGQGVLRKELIRQAESLGVRESVDFAGYVPPADMPSAYQAADVFVLMSEQEGMPNAVLEALASGLPVVSTRVGGVGDLISDGVDGFVVSRNEGEEAASRLQELVSDAAKRRAMGEAARRRAESCSWRNVARGYTDIYHELLKPAGRKMKIAIIGMLAYPLFDPSCKAKFGGAEVQCRLLSKGLAARGHDVAVVTFDHGQPLEQQIDGVRVVKSMKPVTKLSPVRGSLSQFQLWRTLRALGPDVILVPNATGMALTVAVYAMVHRRRSACLVTHDSALTDEGVERSLDRLGFKFGLRLCDGIIVRNHLQEALAVRVHPCRSRFVSHVSTACRIPPEMDSSGREHVLWIGRCVDWKRPEAFARLAERIPEAEFLMIARPQDEKLFKRTVAMAETIANLTVLPGVEFAEKDSYYRRARFLVNTSDAEGFPTTFIEATSLACPVVSLEVDPDGFLSEGRVGFVCKGDEEELFRTAKRLVEDPGLCMEVGRRAYEHVKEYNDFHVVTGEYEAVFEKLLAL